MKGFSISPFYYEFQTLITVYTTKVGVVPVYPNGGGIKFDHPDIAQLQRMGTINFHVNVNNNSLHTFCVGLHCMVLTSISSYIRFLLSPTAPTANSDIGEPGQKYRGNCNIKYIIFRIILFIGVEIWPSISK